MVHLVNEALLAGVPVSPKTDFNNLSSPGFPFDCSMLNPGSYCGYCKHTCPVGCSIAFHLSFQHLIFESRKIVPDVVQVKYSTSFEAVLHIRDGLENLTLLLLHTFHSHL
jgi:hypothetical protein